MQGCYAGYKFGWCFTLFDCSELIWVSSGFGRTYSFWLCLVWVFGRFAGFGTGLLFHIGWEVCCLRYFFVGWLLSVVRLIGRVLLCVFVFWD